MQQRITYLLLFLLLSNWSFAQESNAFSLEDAVQFAFSNNLQIQNAQLNIQDADQQIYERRSIGLPQISGELGYQYYPQRPISVLPEELAIDPNTGMPLPQEQREVSFVLAHNFTAGVSLSSLVFDGSYFVGLRAARLYRDYVQKELQSTRRTVRNQVSEAYLPLLLIDENVGLLDNNIANLTTLLKETQAYYKEGFVEQLDIDRLVLSLANLESEKENLVRQRDMALNGLKLAMNYPAEKELTITGTIEELLLDSSDEQLTSQINYNSRPEYEVALTGLKLNELNVDLYQAGYLPNLAVFANYQQAYFGDDFSSGFWAPTFVVGAQVNIPIFDGFDKRSKIERARIQLKQAQNQTTNLAALIDLEIKNARINYQNALKRVEDQKEYVALAEKIYNTAQIKYKEGIGSSLELSQAEQSLFQTQGNYTQALYNLVTAKIELNKAIGN